MYTYARRCTTPEMGSTSTAGGDRNASTTLMTMSAPLDATPAVTGSPSSAQPRPTATIGFTPIFLT